MKPIQMAGKGLPQFQFGIYMTFRRHFHFLQDYCFLQMVSWAKNKTIRSGRVTQEAHYFVGEFLKEEYQD